MRSILCCVVLAVIVAVAGCRTTTLRNVQDTPFAAVAVEPAKPLSLQDYEAAIIRAGAQRGWTFERAGTGHLVGSVNVRGKHSAQVDVLFNTETFSIVYKDSRNLNYKAETGEIHPNYNHWVSNLEDDIQREITVMKAS